MHRLRLLRTWQYPFILFADKSFHLRSEQIVQINDGIRPINSAANRLIGEVVQSRRRPLLGPSPGSPSSAFTFKTLLRHYAKQALTPRFLDVKLGPRRKGHKGRAVWLA